MKYSIETWNIEKLIEKISSSEINLSPPYQRNEIWTTKSSSRLIDSIHKNIPFPNIFLYKSGDNTFEMVDGKQRASSINNYLKYGTKDSSKRKYSDLSAQEVSNFLKYEIAVTIIEDLGGEEIEKFYTLVNSTGMKLNRPELIKAEFFDTEFFLLAKSLTDSDEIEALNLFSTSTVDRLNDYELVAEILTRLYKKDDFDKKVAVNRMYDGDDGAFNCAAKERLEARFKQILNILHRFNAIKSINETRYKQRNDLYTLFSFLDKCIDIQLSESSMDYIYRCLCELSIHIKPTQDDCEVLQEYAINCVTQSNSKQARKFRYDTIVSLFLNSELFANENQRSIIKFMRLIEELKNLDDRGYYSLTFNF